MFHRVAGVNQKSVLAGDVGGACDFRDDGGVGSEFCLRMNGAGKDAAGDTLDCHRFAHFDFISGVVNRHSPGNARSRWRTIDFAVRKNANVSAVDTVPCTGAGKNRSIQKTQITFEWVL